MGKRFERKLHWAHNQCTGCLHMEVYAICLEFRSNKFCWHALPFPVVLSPVLQFPVQPFPVIPSPVLPSSVHSPVIPPSDLSSKVSKYPLLTSLGIETNFDTEKNEQKIQNLLSELVMLHKNNNKNLNFLTLEIHIQA